MASFSNQTRKHQEQEDRRAGLRPHLVAILVLGIIMYFLFETATDEEVLDISRLLSLSAQEYDYFMTDVDSIHYTAAGRADYRFRASRVTHFPNPEFSLVDAPRFVLFRADASAWRVNADIGRVEVDAATNEERLILSENVIIDGMTAQGRPVHITTDSITVYPGNKILRTDSEVRLESEGFISTSRGLFADLNSNQIRQHGKGRMQYEQPGQGR